MGGASGREVTRALRTSGALARGAFGGARGRERARSRGGAKPAGRCGPRDPVLRAAAHGGRRPADAKHTSLAIRWPAGHSTDKTPRLQSHLSAVLSSIAMSQNKCFPLNVAGSPFHEVRILVVLRSTCIVQGFGLGFGLWRSTRGCCWGPTWASWRVRHAVRHPVCQEDAKTCDSVRGRR